MAEVNEARGEFLFTIGDVEFLMAPSFGRVNKIEGIFGRSLVQVAGELVAGQGLTMRELVGALELLIKEPKMKSDEIGKLVTSVGYAKAIGAINELIDYVVFGEEGDTGDDTEGNESEGKSSDE